MNGRIAIATWRRWTGPAAILAATTLMLWRSWLKWPDLFVDYGQQLYVAWRLAEGEVLYRDIAYFHGPLSSYLHAGVMRLWGTSLLSLVVFNLLLLGVLLWLLYHLLSDLGSRFSATASCLLFVGIFAFGQYLRIGNYNYICPYTYEITHGVILALAAIFCFERHRRQTSKGQLVLAGVLLGLVFLTKVEIFVAAAVALFGGTMALGWQDRLGMRQALRRLAVLGGAALLAPLAAWLLLCLAMPPAAALEAVTRAYSAALTSPAGELAFYRSRMGLDAPASNLWRLVVTSSWQLAALGPAAIAAFVWQRLPKLRWAAATLAALPVLYLAWQLPSAGWFHAARPLPVWVMAVIGACGIQLLRRPAGSGNGPSDNLAPGNAVRPTPGPRAIGILPLALFALALLLKIVLNSRVYHYGFVLAMPATLLLVVVWLEWLPRWITHRGGQGRVFRVSATAILLLATSAHVLRSERYLAAKTYLVAAGGDAFWSDSRGAAIEGLLATLASHRQPGQTLAVFPDGILLNYLLRAPSSLPYLNYVPTEVLAYGEERILADLQQQPPDWVVLVEADTSIFGYRYFGQDYGVELRRFIDRDYRPVGTWGAVPLTGSGFGVQLWRKRSAQPSSSQPRYDWHRQRQQAARHRASAQRLH